MNHEHHENIYIQKEILNLIKKGKLIKTDVLLLSPDHPIRLSFYDIEMARKRMTHLIYNRIFDDLVKNHTQNEIANRLGYSEGYISKLTHRMIEHLMFLLNSGQAFQLEEEDIELMKGER